MTRNHPPFDAELAEVLPLVHQVMPASITPDSITAIRANPLFAVADETLARNQTVGLSSFAVPGPADAPDVTLLVLTPADIGPDAPVFYFLHGGGMIMGNCRTGVDTVLDLAIANRGIVVSVEYRLAPEHPDPAPIEDCYAGLLWVWEHGAEIGIDTGRIILVGISAGAGLASGLALLARDRGGPRALGQLLVCPMLDDRLCTPSSGELDGEGIWDRTSNLTGWEALLGSRRGGKDVSIYTAPSRATDLSGLPSCFIDVGSVETFRDEAIDFAAGLMQAGGQCELHVWAGGFHGFDGLAPHASLSQTAISTRAAWVGRLLATS